MLKSMEILKKCIKCQVLRPLEEFTPALRNKDGHRGACRICYRPYSKKYNKEWRIKNPGKERGYRDPAVDSARQLLRRYGLSEDDRQNLLLKQKYLCAACGEVPSGTKPNSSILHVDHDHKTGEIRGLLCQKCNSALGLLGDNKGKVLKLLAYIERFQ